MTDYNADELEAPTWLNEQFFQQVLQHNEPLEQQYKISELKITPASQRGDHYASIMFRANLSYGNPTNNEQHHSTMVIKTLPPSDTEKGANLSNTRMFETERIMYETLIPRFEQEWAKCGEPVKFAGRLLYYSDSTPQTVIVLEDLCAAGFEVLRERLFNYDEVQLCLRKLAQWHAVSYKLGRQQDADVTRLQHGLFKTQSLLESPFIIKGMQTMIEALEQAGGFEQYLPRLRKLAPQLIARCVAMNDAHANGVLGPLNVLNHGDFHGKNIMVKLSGAQGVVQDVLFIDYQLCFYGTLSYDLTYQSFTLCSKVMREQQREELYQYYFAQFHESLKKLNVPQPWPAYADLQSERKRWCCFELYLISTFLPLTMLNPAELREVDINLVFSSPEYTRTFYMKPAYLENIRALLPLYLEAGYLDKVL